MKPTLFVLAAGMGSRYGGLKQMDGVGPSGETIMDYSIYDAIKAGFGKIVFVIRESFEDVFTEKIVKKYDKQIPVELVFQEIDKLPSGIEANPERVKPWGTNHAVMMGQDVIKEPFVVINADDYYGSEGFQVIADYLTSLEENSKDKYCMVGYRVGNTLSESGTVARGICETDSEGNLTGVVERTQVMRIDGVVNYKDENDNWVPIEDNTPVSMNMWGFTPDYFKYSNDYFVKFLKDNADNLTAEFFIPLLVNQLTVSGTVSVKVLDTPSKWFGVTYADDRPGVVSRLQKLVDEGKYPTPLW